MMEEGKGSITRRPMRRKAICSNCRRRKSKCDSREPQCSTCMAHKSQCHYDKPPSLAYVRSLEAQIEKLLQEKGTAASQETSTKSEVAQSDLSYENRDSTFTSPFTTHSIDTASELSNPSYHAGDGGHAEIKDHDREHWVSEISVNSHGEVCYHGPTSSFYEAPTKDTGSDTAETSPRAVLNTVNDVNAEHAYQIRRSLVSNAAAQRQVEAMAVENILNVQNDVTSDMASELLKYHWCWIHPTFQFVYRPAFTRGLALSSQIPPQTTSYFSETLLKVVLGHCSRFRVQDPQYCDSAAVVMKRLAQHARSALGMSISQASSIPTIQALLQQSAREVAFANSSQAWLYSGIAFRMAIDLGIHLPSEKLSEYVKTLTPEDIEIRKRLYWSCYTWDKAISLYCGRMPAFTPPFDTSVPEFMDDFTEHELWTPYYGDLENHHASTKPPYPPQRGYMISCFTGLCKLSMILSSIMLEIYGASPQSHLPDDEARSIAQNSKNSAFVRISLSIQTWWNELSTVIRLEVNNLPTLSPPLHIVSLNLLYHTTIILLHRPLVIGARDFQNTSVSRSYQICVTATAAIHDLLHLLTSTFGYGHTTYLNCYSTYIAATIAVLHFQLQDETISLPESDVPVEKLDLKFFLRVLQLSATAMPGVDRSVEIVKRHIQSILDRRSKQYVDSLFPVYNNVNTNSTRYSMPHGKQSSSFIHSTSRINEDQIPQHETGDHLQTYPIFNLEGLPAFPGQKFNVGNDFTMDQEITDPEMRAALLGLDSHLVLHHDNSEWNYGGFYTEDQMQ